MGLFPWTWFDDWVIIFRQSGDYLMIINLFFFFCWRWGDPSLWGWDSREPPHKWKEEAYTVGGRAHTSGISLQSEKRSPHRWEVKPTQVGSEAHTCGKSGIQGSILDSWVTCRVASELSNPLLSWLIPLRIQNWTELVMHRASPY